MKACSVSAVSESDLCSLGRSLQKSDHLRHLLFINGRYAKRHGVSVETFHVYNLIDGITAVLILSLDVFPVCLVHSQTPFCIVPFRASLALLIPIPQLKANFSGLTLHTLLLLLLEYTWLLIRLMSS